MVPMHKIPPIRLARLLPASNCPTVRASSCTCSLGVAYEVGVEWCHFVAIEPPPFRDRHRPRVLRLKPPRGPCSCAGIRLLAIFIFSAPEASAISTVVPLFSTLLSIPYFLFLFKGHVNLDHDHRPLRLCGSKGYMSPHPRATVTSCKQSGLLGALPDTPMHSKSSYPW